MTSEMMVGMDLLDRWRAQADHWDELIGIAEDAYAEVAPAKLVAAAQLEHG